ncbi:MAG: ABC transporter ATP-binding protein [Acidiferrobacterales bacterium]
MTVETGIEIHDLHYAYGDKPALDNVSLSLKAGRFTALLGPNGAGKSTLVTLLSGLIVATRGRIEILGEDIARRPRIALARMGIVFQQQTLDLDLTVAQNMFYFAALRGLAGKTARARIDANLERMGLAERKGEKVRALNSGHRRRLEIARALVHTPDVLILDEPTVGLDVPSRNEIIGHIHALCTKQKLTVLWATHLVDEVWEDDDLIVLHAGRVRATGSLREVLAVTHSATVLEAFNQLTAVDGGLPFDEALAS